MYKMYTNKTKQNSVSLRNSYMMFAEVLGKTLKKNVQDKKAVL